MTINIDVLQDNMQYILDHPEEHTQSTWTCSTGACLAGHIALRNGWKTTVWSDYVVPADKAEALDAYLVSTECSLRDLASCLTPTANRAFQRAREDFGIQLVPQVARSVLGVPEYTTYNTEEELNHLHDLDKLFAAGNNAQNMALMVKDISNGEHLDRWVRGSHVMESYIPPLNQKGTDRSWSTSQL